MSQGDQLGYLKGQRLNPFGRSFRDRHDAIADAAEAIYNPQVDGQGIFDVVPGDAMNMEMHPADEPDHTGPMDNGPRVLAQLTGATAAGEYTAQQVVYDDSEGEYITVTDGYVWDSAGEDQGDLICRQLIASLPVDLVVEASIELGDDGLIRWVFDAVGIVIPVDVVTDGGSNGVYPDDPPTWTYTATDKHGHTLGSGLTPENKRDQCTYQAADRGYAWLDAAGAWVLGWVNEEIDLPLFTQEDEDDNYGYWQASADTDPLGAQVAEGIGGLAGETAPGGFGGVMQFIKPERQTCPDNYLGVQTRIVSGDGVDEVHQWIDFSEYKAECPPAAGNILVWDTGTTSWEVGAGTAYSVVTGSDGNSATADTFSWEILFIEATHENMIAGIESLVTEDGANDQAEVTLQLNFADIAGYDAAKKQVLSHDAGTLSWLDTAECP